MTAHVDAIRELSEIDPPEPRLWDGVDFLHWQCECRGDYEHHARQFWARLEVAMRRLGVPGVIDMSLSEGVCTMRVVLPAGEWEEALRAA